MSKTIQEAAREFNEFFKTEKEKSLEKRVQELEHIINNLVDRVNYLESKCD